MESASTPCGVTVARKTAEETTRALCVHVTGCELCRLLIITEWVNAKRGGGR